MSNSGELHLSVISLASRADWDRMAKDLRPVYTAVNEEQAQAKLAEFHDTWGDRYPAIKGLWDNAWGEFIPFLDYSVEIRRVIYSDQRHRVAERQDATGNQSTGHFPNEQAALKCLYLTIRSLDPTGPGAALDEPLEDSPQRPSPSRSATDSSPPTTNNRPRPVTPFS
ncbi:MAG: transposase [Acidimicrobiales bacterium]